MSDTVLKFIPTDPQYVPDLEAQQKAKEILQHFYPDADRVEIVVTEHITFVDPGENLERIFCPLCERHVEIGWWQEAMTMAYQTHFTNLTVSLPCCGRRSSLNDLHYVWDAGFARFIMEVYNSSAAAQDSNQIQLMAQVLACTLKKIQARY